MCFKIFLNHSHGSYLFFKKVELHIGKKCVTQTARYIQVKEMYKQPHETKLPATKSRQNVNIIGV